jgi:hypothetical protein
MKWTYYSLPESDASARTHFFESFSMGASNHALSKRLSKQLAPASGPFFAIAIESLELDQVEDYRSAGSYGRGKQLHEVRGTTMRAIGDRSIDGLIRFLNGYLQGNPDGIVLCENWMLSRHHLSTWTTRESRVLVYGEEVYHVVTNRDVGNLDLIEAAVREPERQWLTGVCSRCKEIPEGEIHSESFFDEIVANLSHIFVSAFDGEGYLVWSPKLPDSK